MTRLSTQVEEKLARIRKLEEQLLASERLRDGGFTLDLYWGGRNVERDLSREASDEMRKDISVIAGNWCTVLSRHLETIAESKTGNYTIE